MTISSAIKRLQFLEYQHGNVELNTVMDHPDDISRIVIEKELVIDIIEHEGRNFCALMPQSYWEEIAPKGIEFKQL